MTPLLATVLLAAGAPPAGSGILVPAARTGGLGDLFLVTPDTGDARNVTRTDGVEELYPAYSPDGARVAFVARDKDGTIEVYACDAGGGNRVAVSRSAEGGRSGCFAPSWSADGAKVVYARGTPGNRFELHVAAADGSADEVIRADGCCPAWSPDGTAIAFVRREPGKPLALMTVAPDGTGERVLVPDLGAVEFADPAWSPDGSALVYPAATAYGWQLFAVPAAGGTPRQLTHLPGLNVNPVWVAPDRLLFSHFDKPGAAGAYLAVKADGTRLDVHPLTKTDPAHPFARPAAYVPRVVAKPARPENPVRQAAAAEPAKPAVALAPVAIVPAAVPGSVAAVGWSADGKRLAFGLEAGAVVVADFDPARGVRPAEVLRGHEGLVAAVGFTPDGGSVVSAGVDRSVRTWGVTPGGSKSVETDHATAVDSVAVSSDGKFVATGDADGVLKLRDAATGKPAREVKASGARRAAVEAVAFGKGDAVVFAGCGRWDVPVLGGCVAAFDPATGKEVWRTGGTMGGVFALAVSPDGGRVAGACLDTFVRVWDAASGKELGCWKGHADRVTGVSWSADGKWVATGGFDHTVRVWDAASGSTVQTLAGHAGPVVRVAFAPDGKHLVSTGRAGAVVVWKVTD